MRRGFVRKSSSNRRRRGGSRGDKRRSNNRSRSKRSGYVKRVRAVQQSDSGNLRERIQIESGDLVLIDQFMLANPQFLKKFENILDAPSEEKIKLIEDYGGCVVPITPSTYRIMRNPYGQSIAIYPQDERIESENISNLATEPAGHVFIDTRCLAMLDRELLDDTALFKKYSKLWFEGAEKECRDLLRDNGGAVRYGFQRTGDELGVYKAPEEDIVALWPDIAESAENES